jgi:hypothetical protein
LTLFLSGATFTDPSSSRAFSPITLTCSTTPSLSGTYQVDSNLIMTLTNLGVIYAVHNSTFAPAMANIAFIDTSNNVHTLPTAADMQRFINAISFYWLEINDYQNRVAAGQNPTLPPATSSVC